MKYKKSLMLSLMILLLITSIVNSITLTGDNVIIASDTNMVNENSNGKQSNLQISSLSNNSQLPGTNNPFENMTHSDIRSLFAHDTSLVDHEIAVQDTLNGTNPNPKINPKNQLTTAPKTVAKTSSIGSIDSNYGDDKAFFLTKEGSYFPQVSYSKISFSSSTSVGNAYLKFKISQDQDTYSRILKVLIDGSESYSTTITSSGVDLQIPLKLNGYFVGITTSTKITIQINWGANDENGWVLDYAMLLKDQDFTPYKLDQQFFPTASYSKIRTYFVGGTMTQMELKVSRVADTSTRYLNVYIDSSTTPVFTTTVSSGGYDGTINLGDFSNREIHMVTIQINWGAYADYSWRLDKMDITWLSTYIQVDWMAGYKPSLSVLNYVGDYYKQNGYERLTFILSSSAVPTDNYVNTTELYHYYMDYNSFDYTNHRYILFGKYSYPTTQWGFMTTDTIGSYYTFSQYAFVAAQKIADSTYNFDDASKVVLMHELGHTFTILKNQGGDEYYGWGSNIYSVMNLISPTSVRSNPWYADGFYWILPNQSGNWWAQRSSMDTSAISDLKSNVDV